MTLDVLAPWYPWTKSLHLISTFAWMAALLYLPRLYVNHHRVPVGSDASELLKGMERRLLKAIMNPAMMATLVFGVLLVLTPGVVDWRAGWWHGKLAGIVALFAMHGILAKARKGFERDERPRTERAWRILNEVPTLALILIVIMVIVKPV